MTKYGFTGTFKTFAGKRDEFIAILLQAAGHMQAVKGCYHYLISKDTKDENSVIVNELWESKEAHDNALKTTDSAALIAQAITLMDGKPESKVLEVMGGKGF